VLFRSLLNFIVAEKLYSDFPGLPEGKLTEIRISLIRQEKLAEKAALLTLGDYMQMGKGEELTGGRTRLNNLADAFESLIAAIYLDRGLDLTRNFILDNFKHEFPAIKAGRLAVNYKALLQELTQAEYKCLPEYEVVEATGPDHDKMFCVSVSIGDVILAVGSGKSKKIAESEAAHLAYGKLSAKG
jgi:ribonuclease III